MATKHPRGGAETGPPLAKRRALRDEVYDVLLEKIAGGAFPAGESLGIETLSAQLGVSPTPVREALVQLEATGLVVRTALRGYRVAPPLSRAAMNELFDARHIIEVSSARLAAARSETLVPVLRETQAQHEVLAAELGQLPVDGPRFADRLAVYLKADWAFHQAIFDAANNRFVVLMAQHISTHGQRMRQFVDTHHVDAELAVVEHRRILEAFETGDADAVAEAVSVHIEAVRVRALGDLTD